MSGFHVLSTGSSNPLQQVRPNLATPGHKTSIIISMTERTAEVVSLQTMVAGSSGGFLMPKPFYLSSQCCRPNQFSVGNWDPYYGRF